MVCAAAFSAEVGQRFTSARRDPAREIEVQMDDGRRVQLPAWRSRHDLPAAPSLGMVRLARTLPADADASRALSAALQCAAFQLPYGGACGGVAVGAGMSPAEITRLCAAYVRAFPDMASIGGRAGAAGTVPAGWQAEDARVPCSALPDGWLRGCGMMRAEAVAHTAAAALARLHPRPGTWALDGYDKAALQLARRMHAAGWRLVAAADGLGAVANPHGLAPSELACAMGHIGTVTALAGERGTMRIGSAGAAEAEVVVVAGSARLGATEASEVGAATVVELAPFAVTAEAEALLAASGKRIVPELIAAAGGPILAHLRWLHRRHRLDWTPLEVKSRLLHRFGRSLDAMLLQGEADLRTAALKAALDFMDGLGGRTAVHPL